MFLGQFTRREDQQFQVIYHRLQSSIMNYHLIQKTFKNFFISVKDLNDHNKKESLVYRIKEQK